MATEIKTLQEAKRARRVTKRTLTTLIQESDALLKEPVGIPEEEFTTLSRKLRGNLEILREINDKVINFAIDDLEPAAYETPERFEEAQTAIETEETAYLDDASDKTLKNIYDLQRKAEEILATKTKPPPESPAPPGCSVSSRMAKLKFPTFSGDIRDYRKFRDQFIYFSKTLEPGEQLYQLVESMERLREKQKIKNCLTIGRAWSILDGEYGDKDRLIDILLSDLEKIENYDNKGHVNLGHMSRFIENLQNFSTHFESLGMSSDLNGRVMLTQLRRKLPEEHHVAFLKAVEDRKVDDTIMGLQQWLQKQLSILRKARSSVPAQNSTSSTRREKPNPTKTSISHTSVGSAGDNDAASASKDSRGQRTQGKKKCPLHPQLSNHFLKGCNKFRSLPQTEKFDVMNSNGICHRCGHDDCISGKPPYDPQRCQFYRPCGVPTCGIDTHFSSICPRVYGTNGYRHFEMKGQILNPTAPSFPQVAKNNSTIVSPIRNSPQVDTTSNVTRVLPTVMARLKHGNKRYLIRILLDTGSQVSLVREGIIPTSCNDTFQNFEITTAGGGVMQRKLRLLDCEIEDFNGTVNRKVSLVEMEKPCGDVPVIRKDDLLDYPYLRDVEINEAQSGVIDILLGVDSGNLINADERITGDSDFDPVAARCPLGWYIQGGSGTNQVKPTVNILSVAPSSELEQFLGLENEPFASKHCRCAINQENKVATETMKDSILQLNDGTYQVALPWRKPPSALPNNFNYAKRRLQNLEKQFQNRPHEWEIYTKQMEDQLKRGVSRVVPDSELKNDYTEGRGMWFLPHFAVVKDSTTTPVRVVFDSKARYQGHSLNDYLAKGDTENSSIFEIGLRFREYEVGVTADISKMFQSFRLSADDARYHRYLFRKSPEEEIVVYELQTVTFGDKPSPAAAVITLRHIASQHAPDNEEIGRVIESQFYVDDLNDSQRLSNDVEKLKVDLTETLNKGNLLIRKWLSNDKVICEPEFVPADGNTSALGTIWNLDKDTLRVKIPENQEIHATKRSILAQTASYYDVYGILSGIIVRPRILLQKLWRFELDWDTPISPDSDLYTELKTIEHDLQQVANIEIDRCMIPPKYRNQPLPKVSLHGFSDASEDAMGMGIWLRFEDPQTAEGELSFVCARARLTPLKQCSIPRKELQALLLLCRLTITVQNALRISIEFTKLWTDSTTVIAWLRGQSKSYRSYVACRVGEITSEYNPFTDIAYVPTDKNVIDHVSRGVDVEKMQSVIGGPSFLCEPPEEWPKMPANIKVDPSDVELKTFHTRNAKVLAASVKVVDPVIDPTMFSSWSRLIMVTARIMSIKDLPKSQWLKGLTSKISEWPSLKWRREAELYWVRYAQQDLNFNEKSTAKLNPFLDKENDVYRVGGRIDKAPVSYDMRHPYLVPKGHIALLITRERHRHALHGGHIRTVAEIRKSYWIISDVKLAKSVIRKCTVCIRNRAKALSQKMAELPRCRLDLFTPAFATTLVDYLGPIEVKLSRNTVSKGYCALFTCAVVRALHLTCVQDLTSEAFLMALDRFVSIRGAPRKMISDNATCFHGADKEINTVQFELNRDKVQAATREFNMTWRFGPPDGPHHQGAVERMVQEVKRAMKVLVKSEKLTFVEWETVFSRISGLLNCRPLTAVSSSPLDDPPVTPNHFLIGRGDLASPEVPCAPFHGNYRERRQLCDELVSNFWKRYITCIQKLSPRPKWSNEEQSVKERDVVLIVDDKLKRGQWKMAEIVKLYPGGDDLVRVVDVRFANGQILKRPITKLVMLMKESERGDV